MLYQNNYIFLHQNVQIIIQRIGESRAKGAGEQSGPSMIF